MKTKSLVRFLNRAAHFDADVELVDVMTRATYAGALHTNPGAHLFTHVDQQRHARLANRQSTDHNRTLALTHLKATICSAFIKDIYEDLNAYFREVLTASAANGLDPNRLIGEHKVALDANDILACGDWNAVLQLISDGLFRRLEALQDTRKLIEKINDKLNLGVDASKIEGALPYLEIRHLLVHNDGSADDAFCARFPQFGATPDAKITLDYSLLDRARTAIIELVNEYDQRIVANDVVAQDELQP
jgi:hypothetical protein